MSAHPLPPSGPDEPSSLSPREREILAGIENDLTATDPALARRLVRRLAASKDSTVPFSKAGTVIVGLLAFVVAIVLVPPGMWLLLVVLTALGVVPWLLLRKIERQDPG
ncbi:MAG: DUF3040 domain-containing protein [Pseudonocardia sp.]|nr:DUF3040 domain-containing protein [Pseudonocardia sp.]